MKIPAFCIPTLKLLLEDIICIPTTFTATMGNKLTKILIVLGFLMFGLSGCVVVREPRPMYIAAEPVYVEPVFVVRPYYWPHHFPARNWR